MRNVFGLAHATESRLADGLLFYLLGQTLDERRAYEAGGDGVDVDVVAAQLRGRRARERHEPRLRRGVVRQAEATPHRLDRGDVDNLARAPHAEEAGRGLRVAERALEVHVHDAPPLLLRHLPQRRVGCRARGVHENVETTEARDRLLDDRDGARVLAHVRAERYHA